MPAQEPPQPAAKLTDPAAAQTAKPLEQKAPQLPAQIELLETRVRFEANGDSRKEVHTRVRINNELGVRQFARLNFDYNRSFQQVELPLMRITHTSGGTADILPGAISDQPNSAVVNFPAYQDVRVKSVRILGLEPSDLLEYRVVTTTTHHPLAPDFWLDHTFDRSGVVSHEIFDLEVPVSRVVKMRVNPATPAIATRTSQDQHAAYRWDKTGVPKAETSGEGSIQEPDIVLTTFADWNQLAERLKNLLKPSAEPSDALFAKASELEAFPGSSDPVSGPRIRAEAFYNFVSQKIATVDLPLGSTGFKPRNPSDILSTGYGTAEDKYILFAALSNLYFGPARAGLISSSSADQSLSIPRPTNFDHLLTMTGYPSITFWLDLNIEVAPFQVIPSQFRGKKALVIGPAMPDVWRQVDDILPFHAKQSVLIDGSVGSDGVLKAKVRYAMRGDNELLLRVAFHQAPHEKWKDVAQLLALSDGFRGKVTSVTASDPYATKEPFTVEYEITQPKFVDWAKKPVRVPALLPLVALPDPPVKASAGAAASVIELGTPLDVQTRVTLHVPPDTGVSAPVGTSVARDYATFSSEYSAHDLTLTAERHIKFLLRQVPAEHAADYAAFVRSVQSDQAQEFTLDRGSAPVARPAAQRRVVTSKP